jgi:hypothetical protein
VPRFLLLVSGPPSDSGPSLEAVEAMNRFNQELSRAGALLALDGLHPPVAGARVRFAPGEAPAVTDGPFTEAKEIIGGFWIIRADSREEAVAWAAKAPLTHAAMIEVRRIAEADDYGPDVAAASRLDEPPPEQTSAG